MSKLTPSLHANLEDQLETWHSQGFSTPGPNDSPRRWRFFTLCGKRKRCDGALMLVNLSVHP